MAHPPPMDLRESTAQVRTRPASTVELLPLWIWLGVAVAVSFFCAPADPVTELLALAFGLVCFGLGCVVGSFWHPMLRLLALVLWGAAVGWLFLSADGLYFVSGAVLYSLVSMAAGAWAFRSIEHGRSRILTSFCGGYVIGSFAGILGTLAGAVLGALLAERCVRPITKEPTGTGGDRRGPDMERRKAKCLSRVS